MKYRRLLILIWLVMIVGVSLLFGWLGGWEAFNVVQKDVEPEGDE